MDVDGRAHLRTIKCTAAVRADLVQDRNPLDDVVEALGDLRDLRLHVCTHTQLAERGYAPRLRGVRMGLGSARA